MRDNGIGMSPELAARVFDLFVQGEEPGKRGAVGLGIGLTLVKHLAELHGGKAFAASTTKSTKQRTAMPGCAPSPR